MERILVSTVTPVYCGEKYLHKLVAELEKVRNEWEEKKLPIELVESIFVDDASIDNSSEVLDELTDKFTWVRVITLSKNFGQHPATIASIMHTSGDWVATLDEDLQHHPRYIYEMLSHAVEGGHDVVYANPENDVHQSFFRDKLSVIYKRLLTKLTGNPNIKKFNSFRMVRGSVARAAASVCGHDGYFDVILCWFTNRIGTILLPLNDQRYIESGISGYNLIKLLSHGRRLVVSSQAKVLRIGTIIGALGITLSVAYGTFIVALKLFSPEKIPIQGWASLMAISLFFGGLIAFVLGIVLEYVSIILLQAQGKPTFFVIDRSKDRLLRGFLREITS